MTGINQGLGSEVDVCSFVVLLNPWLVIFVTQAEIQRQMGENLPVVLKKSCRPPLTLPNANAGERNAQAIHAIEHKVCSRIASSIGQCRVAGKGSGILQSTQRLIVIG